MGKVEEAGELVVSDFEAGVISLDRVRFTTEDVALVVTEPTQKSIEAAQRLAGTASGLSARVLVVANRVQTSEEQKTIDDALCGYESVVVPRTKSSDRQMAKGWHPSMPARSLQVPSPLTVLAERLEL